MTEPTQSEKNSPGKALIIGALGVVYGDIGTSPLYTVRESVARFDNFGAPEVLGVLSLLFWLLMFVVSLKYVTLMLRADNRGEGGTLALMELAVRAATGRRRWVLTIMGLFGACLFYGDSIVTPAISVLSAVEGVGVVSDTFSEWVVPIAVGLLVGLFAVQRRGTGAIGKYFGPVMLVWFLVLGVMGAWRIIQTPQIMLAINPMYAWNLIGQAPLATYLLLGAVVLALTGAETLYADMGHYGRPAIRRAWFAVVLPGLLLCYFGQGALLIAQPDAIRNPFFLMAPSWALIPLVVLATAATVIASQAVISGAFSVTRQAIQLGFWPRMEILHTSAREEGQIFLPRVNQGLLIAVLVLVIGFGSSANLASAYGFAVTLTMLMTSFLAFAVLAPRQKGVRRILWLVLLGMFLLVDILLFSANTQKIHEGGWLPLGVALVLLTMMLTWKTGREQIHQTLAGDQQSLEDFMQGLEEYPPNRVPGTAVFMSMIVNTVPPALLHNLKHNKVLHEQVLFVTVASADVPYVTYNERYTLKRLGRSSWEVVAKWGFKQDPNVPQLLQQLRGEHPEIRLEPMLTSYFLSRQTLIVGKKEPLRRRWRRILFAFMARNAARSTLFYNIPPNQVVEMGMQLEL
ncbi:MAG: potassium transporter Kup [Pusillimonas sp.]